LVVTAIVQSKLTQPVENIILELAGIVTAILKEDFASADKVDAVVF
jgi:hypothetical protein